MSCHPRVTAWTTILQTHLPHLRKPQTTVVALWSLGGHGIPIDDRLWQALRDADLVHPSADRGEVQAFLERHVAASEAKAFCILMRSFGEKAAGTAKRSSAGARKKKTPKTKRAG